MAKMIPNVISERTTSSAEKRLFELFRDELPNQWIVLHSLNLSAASNIRTRETDFVVISSLGVFCLEAKTGRVLGRDGEWFTGSDASVKTSNPFEQSLTASAKIYKFLQAASPISRGILTGSGVLLPDVESNISSMEVNQDLIYDLRDRKYPIEKYIDRIFEYWCNERTTLGNIVRSSPYTSSEIEDISKAIRPNFDLRVPLTLELENTEEQVIRLTQDQYEVLDQIDFNLNPRMMVEGCAGSGKTLCAIEIAKSQSAAGKKVLLTCYNRKLSTYLRNGPLKEYPDVTVQTLHSLMSEIIKDSKQVTFPVQNHDIPPNVYFNETLPNYCMEALKDIVHENYSYDVVVVDEAQDLMTENYILVLNELMQKGLEEGHWVLFLDSNQSIFESSPGTVASQLMSYNPSRHRLKFNCRNTSAAAKLAYALSGYETGTVRIEGPEIGPIWYRDASHEARQISNLISEWLSQGIKPNEITILSHRRLKNSSLASGLSSNVPYDIYEWIDDEEFPPPDSITYSTTQSFKGLESKMVLIIGIDYLADPDRPNMPEINYVGATRSTGATVASVSENLKKELEARLTQTSQTVVSVPEPDPELSFAKIFSTQDGSKSSYVEANQERHSINQVPDDCLEKENVQESQEHLANSEDVFSASLSNLIRYIKKIVS